MAAKQRAIVILENSTRGKFAGQWVGQALRGKLAAKVEAALEPTSGDLWSVKVTDRTFHHDADEEIPAYEVQQKQVFVVVPFRSSFRLTEEEADRIAAIVAEHVGPVTLRV